MGFSGQFFGAIGIAADNRAALGDFARHSGVPVDRLRHYNNANILPSGSDLERILEAAGIGEVELMLAMGRVSKAVLDAIQAKAGLVAEVIGELPQNERPISDAKLVMDTRFGRLFEGDCISFMETLESDSLDMIFADPPFNLNKLYPSSIDDNLKTERYIEWCEAWLYQCIRILRHGGSLFVWNLPKWNAEIASFLKGRLTFVHWIAVDIKYSLPIQGRLYPSHYSLLYFVKGQSARVFHPDRLPMQVCPHCFGDLRDYGGYKDKMNPKGVSLCDVWWDIAPVRHAKYKRRNGANELSLKLMDRIIELSTDEGDLVFDPFGGAGTTYMAAELTGRRWLGVEIGPTDDIIRRFEEIDTERQILADYRKGANVLFTEDVRRGRERMGWWTCESVRAKKGTECVNLSPAVAHAKAPSSPRNTIG